MDEIYIEKHIKLVSKMPQTELGKLFRIVPSVTDIQRFQKIYRSLKK